MKTTVEDISETRKKLKVSFPPEEVERERKSLLGEYAREARFPGFRPGKAPLNLVQKKYARHIEENLRERLTSRAYEDGLAKADLEVVNVIDMQDDVFGPDGDGVICFTLDVLPHFDLPEYKGLPTEIKAAELDEEKMEGAVNELRKQQSAFNVVERAAGKGDYVKLSYEGRVGEQPIAEIATEKRVLGKMENTWEEAGTEDGYGVKAVADGVVGMSAGEKKTVEMDFPEDFQVEALAGKKGVYALEVHEVRQRILPELDEKFFEKLKVKDLDDLRAKIGEDFEHRKKMEDNHVQRQQVAEALAKQVEFPLPESSLELETEAVMRRVVEQNVQKGVPEEELEKHKGEIYENACKAARERVKMEILLIRIAKKEDIKVGNEDMQQWIYSESIKNGVKPEVLVKDLQKDREKVRSINKAIMVNKTLAFLVEQSSVKSV